MKLPCHPFNKTFTKKGRTQEKLTMTNAKVPLPFHNGLACLATSSKVLIHKQHLLAKNQHLLLSYSKVRNLSHTTSLAKKKLAFKCAKEPHTTFQGKDTPPSKGKISLRNSHSCLPSKLVYLHFHYTFQALFKPLK